MLRDAARAKVVASRLRGAYAKSAMSRWLISRLARHSQELFRLAAPVAVSRAGVLMLTTVDIAMLGRYSADAVGYYTLGTSPFIILLVIGIGLMQGVLVATAHHRGAERWAETGQVWRRGLPYAVLIGAIGFALTTQGAPYFALTGQAPALIEASASVTFWQGVGLIPMMLYITTAFFLEGIGRPGPVWIAIWTANLINLPLNWWLIYGGFGVEALGADGAAIATTIARVFMAAALLARERTDEGQHVRLSMLDALIAFVWPEGMAYKTFVSPEFEKMKPVARRDLVFETQDGYMIASTVAHREWQGFCRAAEQPAWLEDPRFQDAAGLVANAGERLEMMAEVLLKFVMMA